MSGAITEQDGIKWQAVEPEEINEGDWARTVFPKKGGATRYTPWDKVAKKEVRTGEYPIFLAFELSGHISHASIVNTPGNPNYWEVLLEGEDLLIEEDA